MQTRQPVAVTGPSNRNMPQPVKDVITEAIGHRHRDDPVLPRTGGPAGNAVLTAWTGLVVLGLSLAELATLLSVHRLIGWHIVIGTLLVPPATLKTASVGWRIIRYYGGNANYRQAGPPPLLLRVLGPGVVLATLGLLASGLVLVALGPELSRTELISVLGHRVDYLTVHQGFFVVWLVLTGLHVLARIVPALRLTVARRDHASAVAGGSGRLVAIVVILAVAVACAVLVLFAAGGWHSSGGRDRPGVPKARSTGWNSRLVDGVPSPGSSTWRTLTPAP
jgi:hypothetical protein